MQVKMKRANPGIPEKFLQPVRFLARIVSGIFFIQVGLNKLQELNHFKSVLNFFWITIPSGHRWDAFLSSVELICGTLILLGLLTRAAAIVLFGILAAGVFNLNIKELSGLELSALQVFFMSAFLLGLSSAGAGRASLDQILFKSHRRRILYKPA